MENIVNNLDGYLLSMRRLSGNQYDYWAEILDITAGVETALTNHFYKINPELKVIEKYEICYLDVEKLLVEYIFSQLAFTNENIKKLFLWDIVEYFGLASTQDDPEGDFNPLVSNGALKLSMQPNFYKSHVYLVVPISNYAIIMGLAKRA
jgi:hypothetical protein